MKDIVIIKTGDSIPSLVAKRGDFEDWIIAGMGNGYAFPCPVIAVHSGETPPDVKQISGIVITGSHAMVTDQADWIEMTIAWLLTAIRRDIPVLGICFGHQMLACALGGKVGEMPAGPEFGTVPVSLTADAETDPLFRNLPQPADVQTSHFQSVTTLPPGSTLLAFSEKDAHSAFRFGPCAWGVQFHPEYDTDIAKAYIHEFSNDLKKFYGDVSALSGNCRNTPAARQILSRFAEFVTNPGLSKF